MASSDCIVDVEILEARLRTREPGRTPAKLAILDIGTFPTSPPASTQEIPERAAAENFHFLKWIHRSNNSDLALVTLQNDSNLKILKIVRPSAGFGGTRCLSCHSTRENIPSLLRRLHTRVSKRAVSNLLVQYLNAMDGQWSSQRASFLVIYLHAPVTKKASNEL